MLPNVAAAPRRLTKPPTQTSVGLLAQTESKRMTPSAAGNGSVTSASVQVVPFQCMTSADLLPLATRRSPTAQTSLAAVPNMP